MSVTVHVSSQLVPIVGKEEVALKSKKRGLTVDDAIEELAVTYPGLAERFGRKKEPGRIGRLAFVALSWVNGAVAAALGLFVFALLAVTGLGLVGVVLLKLGLVSLIALPGQYLLVTARLRDMGRSTGIWWWILVPIVSLIFWVWLALKPGLPLPEMPEWLKIFVDDKEIFEDLAGLDTRVPDGTKLRIEVPGKARVTFVQENRIVEVEPGRTIKEIALELGIDPNRKYQRLISCEGLGIFDGCLCWVKPSSKRAVNGRSWTERALHALHGWQRLACQTRVFGDVEVWTLPQGDERLREPRPVAAPPPQPKKRERYLESIFRTPAADDEEGDAETKPAAKKMPTDTKAKVAAGAAPGAVPVDTKAAAAAVAAPAVPDAQQAAIDAQNAKLKSERPASAQAAPGPSEPKSGVVDPGAKNDQMPPSLDAARPETPRVEDTAQAKGVATPIVSPITAASGSTRPPKGADEPKAVDDAKPSEGAKTAAAEANEAPTATDEKKSE